jgi:hypothetical protein
MQNCAILLYGSNFLSKVAVLIYINVVCDSVQIKSFRAPLGEFQAGSICDSQAAL